jgi:holo-[acyl-carrier protein] synthase
MILGLGNDLCDIRRIRRVYDRHGDRFLTRCFTGYEQELVARSATPAAQLAKFFAAKEAAAKALGTGFSNGVNLCDIGVVHNKRGKPMINFTNGAQSRLEDLMPLGTTAKAHLTLSDEPPYANAVVIIEASD